MTNYTSWQHIKCAAVLKLSAQYYFAFCVWNLTFHNLTTPIKQLFKMSKKKKKKRQPLIQIYSSNILGSCWGRQRDWTKYLVYLYCDGFPDCQFQSFFLRNMILRYSVPGHLRPGKPYLGIHFSKGIFFLVHRTAARPQLLCYSLCDGNLHHIIYAQAVEAKQTNLDIKSLLTQRIYCIQKPNVLI